MKAVSKQLASGLLSIFVPFSAHAALTNDRDAQLIPEAAPFITSQHTQTIYRNLVEKHWVPQTGLFISFLGTSDNKLVQQASTYEQAAIGILAVRLADIPRARRIFDFMRKSWTEDAFKNGREGVYGLANFYNAEFGGAGIEKTIHVGPNAWAGLFAATLANRTGDKDAAAWALEVARWIAKDIPHKDGGVAMGPVDGQDGVPWTKVYSTENNISYYAFLSELLRGRELPPQDRTMLTEEKGHVEDWLVSTAFDRSAYTMNRGTNPGGIDRIRALDTTTWLISAVGPKRMKERGIDPDRLMRQARDSFIVRVKGLHGVDATNQPEADLTFVSPSNDLIPRFGTQRPAADKHRMIWYEGLGQYINTLHVMAHYSQDAGRMEKANQYIQEARVLTQQFDLASLKSHQAGAAYAYAMEGKFFHDGWFPPADASDGPPSSLIAAVWRCFAGLGFDPLATGDIPGVAAVTVPDPEIVKVRHERPSVLYGTSEDMVVRAWVLLDQGNTDQAIQQAQATIQEWSPWARKLQEKKVRQVGHVLEYTGMPEQSQKIFNYWALNDVGAAYFIIGKAYDKERHYAEAAAAFQQIMLNYSLAQVWDPRGWFWSPFEAVGDEYVSINPRRYGNLMPQLLAGSPPAVGAKPF